MLLTGSEMFYIIKYKNYIKGRFVYQVWFRDDFKRTISEVLADGTFRSTSPISHSLHCIMTDQSIFSTHFFDEAFEQLALEML